MRDSDVDTIAPDAASARPRPGGAKDSHTDPDRTAPDRDSPDRTAPGRAPAGTPSAPPRKRLALIAAVIVLLLGVLLAVGYLPRRERKRELAGSVAERKSSLPEVSVVRVKISPAHSDLLFPGNITPLTEAVLNARADGYVRKRYADIGDRVRAGQLLAEIEAPELDQQVRQAQAGLSQTKAALNRAQHAFTQATANLRLAELTVERWKTLSGRGVVSRQEFDQKQADYESQQASVQSAQADIRAAEDNVRASEANVERLIDLQRYQRVTAPFSGIITARNIDIGSLINSSGSTPLFRMAQIDVLRIMVDVPEQSAPAIKVGEPAEITLQEFGARKFLGRVSRTANALDANTRTLPTEIQVPNRDGALLPNMYAQVKLIGARATPSILIPGDALVVRPNGVQVATVAEGNRVRMQMVEVGRDYGPEIEIRSGLSEGQYVIVNPADVVKDGAQVNPVVQKRPAPAGAPPRPAR